MADNEDTLPMPALSAASLAAPDRPGSRLMTFEDAYTQVLRETRDAHAREEIALFCLGPKGQHYDGQEWEDRADWWHGRALAAEAIVANDRP